MPFIHNLPGEIAKGVTLACHDHLPEADRIRWDVRVLSVSEADKYARDLSIAYANPTREAFTAIATLIKSIVTGWSNIVGENGEPVPFNDAALELFNLETLYVIALQLPTAAGWGGLKKKA